MRKTINSLNMTARVSFKIRKLSMLIFAAVLSACMTVPSFAEEEELRFTEKQARLVLENYSRGRYSTEKAVNYIMDEEMETDSVFSLWYRSYTGFTIKYAADLITGDVIESSPYNGKIPDATLPFGEGYAFNLEDYIGDPSTYEEEDVYLIPDSLDREIDEDDIEGFSLQQINYAKNEIFARHGRMFLSQELTEYFESLPWYTGTLPPDRFVDDWLTDTERANAEFLREKEFEMDPNGYALDTPGYDISVVL